MISEVVYYLKNLDLVQIKRVLNATEPNPVNELSQAKDAVEVVIAMGYSFDNLFSMINGLTLLVLELEIGMLRSAGVPEGIIELLNLLI